MPPRDLHFKISIQDNSDVEIVRITLPSAHGMASKQKLKLFLVRNLGGRESIVLSVCVCVCVWLLAWALGVGEEEEKETKVL